MEGGTVDELLRRLGEVQARAAGVAGAFRAGEARLPAETEGTDPSGVARVQVGARGEPVGIAFADGWRDALADGGLGAAVVAAAQAAASARADALRAAMESEQPSDEAPPPVAAPWSPPDPEALPTTALEDLAERAMAAASAIRSFTASVDTTPTTGTSTGGEVTVTLVGDQVVDCAVDAGGAQALSTSGLTMAANEALGRARAEAAARVRPVRDPELDTIFGEAIAHLNAMLRQSSVPGGTGV